MPPAHPMLNSSSSSVSRFNNISPSRIPCSNSKAPVIPVSSSIVNNASKGGWITLLLAKRAIIEATPMPLSAPNVVPFAVTH